MSEENNNESYTCIDCGLHYKTEELASACAQACEKGACDSEITVQSIERSEPEEEKEEEDFEGKWKRALADYQNLQKEMSTERIRMRKGALKDVVEALLPIMDNFSASTAHEPDLSSRKPEGLSGTQLKQIENWVAGVGHIRKQMEDMLGEFGVKRIETEGKAFDASLMEAVGEEASSNGVKAKESGVVLRETSPGYTLGDTIIRPAKVITVK